MYYKLHPSKLGFQISMKRFNMQSAVACKCEKFLIIVVHISLIYTSQATLETNVSHCLHTASQAPTSWKQKEKEMECSHEILALFILFRKPLVLKNLTHLRMRKFLLNYSYHSTFTDWISLGKNNYLLFHQFSINLQWGNLWRNQLDSSRSHFNQKTLSENGLLFFHQGLLLFM